MSTTTHQGIERLSELLGSHGQMHLLGFWDDLDMGGRANLFEELSALDLGLVDDLMDVASSPPVSNGAAAIEPPDLVTLSEVRDGGGRIAAARERGVEEFAAGRVGMVLVAGGQASRLGCDGPKGDFPVGPVSGSTLFDFHARRILKMVRRFDVRIPWYVMTSPENHAETQRIFNANHFFGLNPLDVSFFCQQMLPALDEEGRVLLKGKDSLSLAPNGHGGVLEGLVSSGCIQDARSRGVETLSYFQVDNPLARPTDPLFIGLHCLGQAAMSSKVVTKTQPEEEVGVLGSVGGRLGCIEYSDMPDELLHKRREDGGLLFSAGNIAIHAISVDFIAEITDGGLSLPWHVARKKIATLNSSGEACERDGMKFEKFVFDALGLAAKSVTLEVDRGSEFAPVKNRLGPDSPDTARESICALHSGWVEAAGLELPAPGEDGVISVEVDPLIAEDRDEFRDGLPREPLVSGEGHLYH